jgi:hypothetical protein
MSDWTEILDARRAGLVEGFHGADERIDKLPDEQVPATGDLAPESDAPQPPALPVEAAIGGHAKLPGKASAAKKTSAKKTSSRKNV